MAKPSFQQLAKEATILATWDDHDYGKNDAGREYAMRKEAQKEFLRAWEVLKFDARWRRKGVYSSHLFGPEDKRVQVILLDTRYHRTTHQANPREKRKELGRWKINDSDDATILGDEQWSWLEEQLKVPAKLRIIGTSIQLIAQEHPYERWDLFPKERERFLKLLKEQEVNHVILISGDRHAAEISVIPGDSEEGIGYPLIDATSSGMNQAGGILNEDNRWRTADDTYRLPNFGWIEMDWNAAAPSVDVQIRSEKDDVIFSKKVALSELKHRK